MARTLARSTRKTAAAALATAGVLMLSGCAAGFDAQTNQRRATGNGAQGAVGTIEIRDATIVLPADAKDGGVPSTATLISTFWNTGAPDALTGVEVAGAETTKVVAPEVPILTELRAPIGFEPAGRGNAVPKVNFEGFKAARSSYVDVTYIFKTNGRITLPVLTVPATGYYEGITP